MSVTITTGTGSREVLASRVVEDPATFYLEGMHIDEATDLLGVGDRGYVPLPLVIEFEIFGATLSGVAAEVAALVSDAKAAQSVTTARGVRSVSGVLGVEVRPQGVAALVRCSFAPTVGGYS